MKTPKLKIYNDPAPRELEPKVELTAGRIWLNEDARKLLGLKKGQRIVMANKQQSRKSWYIRKETKTGAAMEADGHFEQCPGITTPVLASFGPDVKQLAGKIELKEKLGGDPIRAVTYWTEEADEDPRAWAKDEKGQSYATYAWVFRGTYGTLNSGSYARFSTYAARVLRAL